ncbi:MAG: hypothetical protein NC911_03520 [Candidatus Omnitrophica bacterium]|nr:hypothetical protein [Candidatus Omnitrophota bacterium]
MTNRERFIRTMNYQPVDRRPLHVVGPWPETLTRWKKEGLPEGMDVHVYLGVQPLRSVYVGGFTGPWPPFEQKVIEESGGVKISIDNYGRKVKTLVDTPSVFEFLEYPVKSPDDLRRVIEEHYQIEPIEARFGPEWEKRISLEGKGDAITVVDGGCYYWTLRSLAGVEMASYLLYDAPELVEELFERYLTVVIEGIVRACERIVVDCVGFGEDIAYKAGPLLSPEMFRRFILPRYRKAMEVAHLRGVRLTWFDSDGDLKPLIPDMLSVGIDTVAPCEVAAGMAPRILRKRWGKAVKMIGGIDKREVAKGPAAIDQEIERIRPVIEEGGFIPAIDHSVSADISFSHYCYFIRKLEQVIAKA